MKLGKLLAAALSGLVAAMTLATSVSAYLEVPADKASLLSANAESWNMMVSSSYDINYDELNAVQAYVTLTNPEQYEADKAAGFYSDGETEFTDFAGNIAFGSTAEYLAFGFSTLADAAGGGSDATVSSLGGGVYVITGYLTAAQAETIMGRCSVVFAAWGNVSPDYVLRLDSISLIDTSGTAMLTYNGSGYPTIEPPAVTTTVTEAPVEETTTTTTTTAATTTTTTTTTTEATTTTTTTTTEATTTTPEETTTVAEETEEASEEAETTTTAATTTTTTTTTTTAAETTISETTTAAVATTAAVEQAVASESDDFASRNSSLLIFAIVAGVIIIAVIVAFVIIALKKKK